MGEQEPAVTDGYARGYRQFGQVPQVLRLQVLPGQFTGGAGQEAKTVLAFNGGALGDGVVMIAANRVVRVGANPFDARDGMRPVVHRIAQKEAQVMRFLDGLQCRPVRMDVSEDQNAHYQAPWRTRGKAILP